MKKGLFIILGLLILSTSVYADRKKVIIVNNTEYTIKGIHSSSVKNPRWSSNYLESGQTVQWKDKVTIFIESDSECLYNFKLVDIENDVYRKIEVNVCVTSEIVFIFVDYITDVQDSSYNSENDPAGDKTIISDAFLADNSYETGFTDGYEEGYRDSFKDAYRQGFLDGLKAAKEMSNEE